MKSLFAILKRIAVRLLGRNATVSADYQLDPSDPGQLKGWTAVSVAERQHDAYEPLIAQALAGNPRLDFRVAADMIAFTGETQPRVLEIGCGSGYYSAVLPALLNAPIRYTGIDYSVAMTALAGKLFPDADVVAGDALALPIATGSCDIALSGTSLMHIPDYRTAIAEMVRVSRRWCLFHTVPVLQKRATTVMSKRAYGERVPEIVFNRNELEQVLAEFGMRVRHVRESFPYDLSSVLGEKTITLSYLCEKT